MPEIWDIYDVLMQPKNRTHPRKQPLVYGDYHLVVFAWAVREDGAVLMTRRAPQKSYSGYYECTGGCAFAGESPRTAAARELLEETGLSAPPESGRLVRLRRRVDDFACTYLFRFPMTASPKPQPGETVTPTWLTLPEYDELLRKGRVVPSASDLRQLLESAAADAPSLEGLLPGTVLMD